MSKTTLKHTPLCAFDRASRLVSFAHAWIKCRVEAQRRAGSLITPTKQCVAAELPTSGAVRRPVRREIRVPHPSLLFTHTWQVQCWNTCQETRLRGEQM